MTESARDHAPRLARREQSSAALAWLANAFDERGEARERAPWTGRVRTPGRRASLQAARALALADRGAEQVARTCTTLLAEQRADGGFELQPRSAVADPATTALAVELLCAQHARSGAHADALARAGTWLAHASPRPDVVRALVALARTGLVRDVDDALQRAARALESEFELSALQPLASTAEAADRAHAWHAAAARLELDLRRHPAVRQGTAALVQRAEASAGALCDAYTSEGRVAGPSAASVTSARAALALFAVHDVIVAPRAAFAAEFVLDSLVARRSDGAVRERAARTAVRSVSATALFVEALLASDARAAIPWTLPDVDPALGADTGYVRRA
jgi:hypothetical protein